MKNCHRQYSIHIDIMTTVLQHLCKHESCECNTERVPRHTVSFRHKGTFLYPSLSRKLFETASGLIQRNDFFQFRIHLQVPSHR